MIYHSRARRKACWRRFKEGGQVSNEDLVTELPKKTQATYDKIKDVPIKDIVIARAPVNSAIQLLVNVSLGGIHEIRDKYGIDTLWHLYLIITLSDGSRYAIEKNQNIDISKYHKRSNEETMQVSLSQTRNSGLTTGVLMNNAKRRMGSSFYDYDFKNNNCQRFINNLLSASGLATSNTNGFVNQPIKDLLDAIPGRVTDVANMITDTAAALDKAVQILS